MEKKELNEQLERLRAALANARAECDGAQGRVSLLEEQLADLDLYKRLTSARDDLNAKRDVVKELEYRIKREVGEYFTQYGRPTVAGLRIRVYTVVDLLDERLAVAALMHKMPSILAVDRKRFDSLVKELSPEALRDLGLGPAVVKVSEDPRPTIMRDLSKYVTCRFCGKPAGAQVGWMKDERAHSACARKATEGNWSPDEADHPGD